MIYNETSLLNRSVIPSAVADDSSTHRCRPLSFLVDRAVRLSQFCHNSLESLADKALRLSLFSGFYENKLTAEIQAERSLQLHREFDIEPYEPVHSRVTGAPIDFIHLKSQSLNRTGNAVVFVHNSPYQFFSRKQFAHLLLDGADVILYNPTRLDFETMEEDLKSVLDAALSSNPSMNFCLYGYCMGSQIAAKVACTYLVNGKTNIPFIFDRGFGNTRELAAKVNRLAVAFQFVREVMERKYNLNVDEVISGHSGSMLVLSPPQGKDQLMHKGEGINLTVKLAQYHSSGDTVFRKVHGDHWSSKDAEAWNEIKSFLSSCGILPEIYTTVSSEDFPSDVPSCFRRSCITYKCL